MTDHTPGGSSGDITCQEVVKWVSAFLDQHLDDATKARIVVHVALCTGCEAYLRQIATIRDLVGSLPRSGQEQVQQDRVREAFRAR